MKVSILIPIYNSESTLYRCLNSVLNQTLKEFECYLINDGSTDKSGEICDEFCKKDSRFKVVHQENMGVAKSMNKVSTLCKGEYIGTIDSDDYIEPDFYELLYNKAKEFDIDFIKYNSVCSYYIDKVISKKAKIITDDDLCDKVIMPYDQVLLKHTGFTSLWNGIYKKRIWNKIQFNENILKAGPQDVYPTYKLIENSDKLYIINDCKYVYYENENSYGHNTKEVIKYLPLEHKRLIKTSKNKYMLVNIIIDQLYYQYIIAQQKNIDTSNYVKEIIKIINELSLSSLKYCTQLTLEKIKRLLVV